MHCAVCVRGTLRGTLRSLRPRYTAQSASSTVCSTGGGGGGGYRTWDQELEVAEEMEEVLVEDSSTRTSSKGATAGEMESMMDLKSPAETTAAAAVAAEDLPEDEEGELQEQQEQQEVVAADSQHQQHQHQSCMDQASNGSLMQSYNEDEDEDDEEIERSRHFAQALKELKSLRPQLYSAAEYCESSYLYSDQKQV